jgi:molybdate transport system ATP-binding protein
MKSRLAVALRGLSVRRGARWVLRDITWRLKPGERWALLGENGAGKTQLLKILSGDVWPTPTPGGAARRAYLARGHTVDLRDAKPRMAYVGGEHQDKYSRYQWNLCVRDVVTTGLKHTDLLLSAPTRAEAGRVTAMLSECGIARLARRKFLSISYGEKRLTLLARALAQDPDWLLLDEVYNGLDAEYRRRVEGMLEAARRRGQSWVATAHRAADLPRGTRRLIELAEGRIRQIKPLLRADSTRMTLQAEEDIPLHRHRPRRHAPSARIKRSGAVLVQLIDVDLFVEYRPVLRAVNWQLRRGEHWSVFGANGAGKSSFLKLLYGDLSPATGGKIVRAGLAAGAPISEWKKRVGYVSPELQSLYAVDVAVLELVASGRHSSIGLAQPMTAADKKAARRWLKFFKLLSVAARRPRELSYGQLRRALIARAMAADPQILLLDEPLTGLDPKQRAAIKRLLVRLMQRQLTVVAAVHHAEDLPRGMTRALHLHKRQVHCEDSHSATQAAAH